jgi:hypothetical protein
MHNEELRNLYSSPSIIRIIKSRRMRLGGACSPNGEGEEERVKVIGGNAKRRETTRKAKT